MSLNKIIFKYKTQKQQTRKRLGNFGLSKGNYEMSSDEYRLNAKHSSNSCH